MKKTKLHLHLLAACVAALAGYSTAMSQQATSGHILNKVGMIQSADKYCTATVGAGQEGGYLRLKVTNKRKRSMPKDVAVIDDVTGIGWRDSRRLIASVSSIYGKPGLYEVDCQTEKVKRLVAPITINDAYPDGADYFELQDIVDHKILYYYGADVDEIDFKTFRTLKQLRGYQFSK